MVEPIGIKLNGIERKSWTRIYFSSSLLINLLECSSTHDDADGDDGDDGGDDGGDDDDDDDDDGDDGGDAGDDDDDDEDDVVVYSC